jgi:hypothetical protein
MEKKRSIYWEGISSRNGRSTLIIECPFCEEEVVAFKWSFAGCGKRCPCGAKHVYGGYTIKD